jgi:hypothetical protein
MFPCAVMMLPLAALGYAAVAIVAASAASMTCTAEVPVGICLSAMVGLSAGFLMALAIENAVLRKIAGAAVGLIAGAGTLVAVAYVYSRHCNLLLPLLRQLLPA